MLGVLVLAAGKSTRIAGITGGAPKPLMRLRGKRLIEWSLEWLASWGVRSVWVNLHYGAEAMRSALGDGGRYGLRIRYVYEPEIRGTAGAWRDVASVGGGSWLVVYGDNVMRFDLDRFVAVHRERGAAATVALFDPARHANTGIAGGRAVLGAGGRITGFREGGAARAGEGALVNAGAYLLEDEVLGYIPAGYQDFGRDVLPGLAEAGKLFGHVLEDDAYCLGVDTPERYAVAEALIEAGGVPLG
ncbi:MAG TPA: nucleotidyltransferase family protein [Longimicrobiales bacterium]